MKDMHRFLCGVKYVCRSGNPAADAHLQHKTLVHECAGDGLDCM